MITVLASIRIKEGKIPEYLDIFKANIPHVKNEKGCIEYFPAVDIDSNHPAQERDSNIVTIVEKWESLDTLYNHLQTPHMLAYRENVKDIVENVSIKILQQA
jgi:quinol monooxygenase YgiN